MAEASRKTTEAPADAETSAPEPDSWKTALEGLDLIVLDPIACSIEGDGSGRLWGEVNGRHYDELIAYMTHPLSDPEEWISIIAVEDADSDGRRSDGGQSDRVELGVLPDLRGLDQASRTALQDALRLRYFMPRVLQIVSVRDEDPGQTGAVQWELLTDRGPMRLRMASLFDGIQQLEETGRLILADRDGNRCDIPEVKALDPASRKLLERYYWF